MAAREHEALEYVGTYMLTSAITEEIFDGPSNHK